MRGARHVVQLVLLAALLPGCSGAEPTSRADNRPTVPPSSPATPPAPPEEVRPEEIIPRAQLAAFFRSTRILTGGEAGADSFLEDVRYTSPTDAAADFWDCRVNEKDECTTVIMTTSDNWASAAGIAIPDRVADLVDYTPLGDGSVAIKARDQIGRVSYRPFVLRPDGTTSLLRVSRLPRPAGAGIRVLGGPHWHPDLVAGQVRGTWAVAPDGTEVFPLRGSPNGMIWQQVPGRGRAVLNVHGYRGRTGAGVWQFAESTNLGRTWRTTDVRFPLGGGPLWRYADGHLAAVGPGRRQAVALTTQSEDGPRQLAALWLTDDERAFRRVPLTRTPTDLGGVAFAPDGSLLLGEATGGRLWRLPAGATDIEPVPDGPSLSEPAGWSTLVNSGGVIVARTGPRTLATSTDGLTWERVTPGG